MAQDECDKAQKTLTTAQESLPDDALDRELKNAECECEDHRIACEKAENYYHSLKPDQVDHKVEQTQRDVQDLERRLTEYREKKMRIEGEIKGKYSSDTDLSEAEEMLTQKINALTSVELRAHAAQRLHDLVEKHYQDAKEKYFGPYIQALTKKAGRVFGADVSFTTDDTVANGTSSKKTRNQRIVAATQVSQRVLDGRAVNVADLSGGAVEQLQIVQRLAVADVVGDKSVPIFLDDALGYADNERITKMNELLTESGKKHQVIIMTCAPERYRSVDAARSIEMF